MSQPESGARPLEKLDDDLDEILADLAEGVTNLYTARCRTTEVLEAFAAAEPAPRVCAVVKIFLDSVLIHD